jgi:hypothetical protein
MIVDLLVGLIVRPLVRLWQSPRVDPDAGLFQLGADEQVVATSPARCASGRSWPGGLLVLTNRKLWFFPSDPMREPWSRPLDDLTEIRLLPSPPVAWGFLGNWPDRVTFATSEGMREAFVVPEPPVVLSWFQPTQIA